MQSIKTYRTDDLTPPPHRGLLPIKKHLLQFVAWREHLPDLVTPLTVPGLGPIAAALDMVLTTGEAYLRSNSWLTIDTYGARLHYIVQDIPRLKQDTLYVTDAGAAQFNRFLEQLMRDDLNSRILDGKKRGEQEKRIIEQFLDETGLNETLDLDAEKKAQWRLRNHRGMPRVRGHHIMRGTAAQPAPQEGRYAGRVRW